MQKEEVKSEEQKIVTSAASENVVGFKDQKNQTLQLNVSTLSLSLSLSFSLSLSLPPSKCDWMMDLLQAEELQRQDVNLSNLSGCEVKLRGPPSTLHMSKMDNCT